jgi:hypothetical protein
VTGGEFLDHFILNVISLSFSTMTHGPVQCRTILDLRLTDPIGIEKDERKLTSEYVRILENNLKEGHEIARKNLNTAAKKQKMTYDVKVRRP